MNNLQRTVVLLDLIENLRIQGSWCGETHIQKSVYFLQTIFNVPLNYEYTLCLYGPFSFDLSDELAKIRADGLLTIVPTAPFGVTFQIDEGSRELCEKFPKTIKEFGPAIRFLTTEIGKKDVKELTELATLHYLGVQNDKEVSCGDLIGELMEVIPHISEEDVVESFRILDGIKLRWEANNGNK